MNEKDYCEIDIRASLHTFDSLVAKRLKIIATFS
jgi:hypothetical protein